MMRNKAIRIGFFILFFVLLLVGLCLIVVPQLQVMKTENIIDESVEEWKESYAEPVEAEKAADPEPMIFPELLAAMQEYNAEIYNNGQSELVDAWSYQSDVFDLSTYGLTDDMVGFISIPKIEVELPLYLGASYENLAKGFAQFSQTSMPIGGINTNCVVACHRGYNGAAYLRDAHLLEVGDMIYLQNFWEKLSYKVCEIKVIDPSEIDEILIQPERDLLTVITCTPYRVGSHRMLIFCERVEN